MTTDYIVNQSTTIVVLTQEDLRPYIFLSLIMEGRSPKDLGLEWGRRGIALWEAPPAYMFVEHGLWHKKTNDGTPNLQMQKSGELFIPDKIARDYYNYGLPSRVVLEWKPSGFNHPSEVVEKYKDVRRDGWAGSPLGNF